VARIGGLYRLEHALLAGDHRWNATLAQGGLHRQRLPVGRDQDRHVAGGDRPRLSALVGLAWDRMQPRVRVHQASHVGGDPRVVAIAPTAAGVVE
jgi:hypothetical protein